MHDIATVATGKSNGHDLCSPVYPAEGVDYVLVNDSPVCVVGNKMQPHGCIVHPSHQGVISTGSGIMFIDDKPVAFVTSEIDCQAESQIVQGDSLVQIES